MGDGHETPFPRPLSGDIVSSPPPSLVPPRRVLEGEVVRLEPLNPETHLDALYEASHGSATALRIWDYLPYGPWSNKNDYAEALRGESASFDWIAYVIRVKKTDNVRGHACYLDIHPQTGVIEIGYIWFGEELQRTRGATEALYLMVKHAMCDLGYRRMQWRCNSLNEKSRNAARRLGFRFEGIFYNHMIYKGKNRDTAWYSILDDEWPEVQGIIESWLAPSNFSKDGLVNTSLSALMAQRRPVSRGVEV